MTDSISDRLSFANQLARRAGEAGMAYFRKRDDLTIENKGHQDLVSNADREVETLIRDALVQAYPGDGLIGEEHGRVQSTTGYAWVIDPIDGTANFIAGIPAWCVVIACVKDARAIVGVTHEPNIGETFTAARGLGATLNGKPMSVSSSDSLAAGSMGVGFSNRTKVAPVLRFIRDMTGEGGVFFRNASGALMLSYVAAGRLLGYVEPHMNPWDCVAGLLQIEEAGGLVLPVDPATMLRQGGPVVTACPGVFEPTRTLATAAFSL